MNLNSRLPAPAAAHRRPVPSPEAPETPRGPRRQSTIAALLALLAACGAKAASAQEPGPASWYAARPSALPWGTATESDDIVRRAGELAAAGRTDLAAGLWQRAIDEGARAAVAQANGEIVTTRNVYVMYLPQREVIERRIVEAGPESLRDYRREADASARALLAAAPAEDVRREALAEIESRLFLSSLGDDAAFELACLNLERREYSAAANLLQRVRQHPDSDVPTAELDVRAAVAASRMGDADGAAAAMDRLGGDPRGQALRDAGFQLSSAPPASSVAARDWPTAWGNASRTAAAVDPLAVGTPRTLSPAWTQAYDVPAASSAAWATPSAVLRNGQNPQNRQGRVVPIEKIDGGWRIVPDPANAGRQPEPEVRSTIVEMWRTSSRFPAGGVLNQGGKILVRGPERVVCHAADTGRILWMGRRNVLPLPREPRWVALDAHGDPVWDSLIVGGQEGFQPSHFSEEWLLHSSSRAMTVAGDLVIVREGRPLPLFDDLGAANSIGPSAGAAAQARDNLPPIVRRADEFAVLRARPGRMILPRPGRGAAPAEAAAGAEAGQGDPARDWLSAYDLRTGKLKWTRSVAGPELGPAGEFSGAPLAAGRWLIVPYDDFNGRSLLAIDPQSGETVWRTLLCQSQGDARIPSAPGLACLDGVVCVATGCGLAMGVDALTGRPLWATAYPQRRDMLPAGARMQAIGGARRIIVPARSNPDSGRFAPPFQEEVALGARGLVIVLSSESENAMAFSLADGRLRWEAPLSPTRQLTGAAESCIGVRDGVLVLSGRNIVRGYRVETGKILWEQRLEGPCGRGLLTDRRLWMPDRDEILLIDVRTGGLEARLRANWPDAGAAGNLTSDGERLYVQSPLGVSAWTVNGEGEP